MEYILHDVEELCVAHVMHNASRKAVLVNHSQLYKVLTSKVLEFVVQTSDTYKSDKCLCSYMWNLCSQIPQESVQKYKIKN